MEKKKHGHYLREQKCNILKSKWKKKKHGHYLREHKCNILKSKWKKKKTWSLSQGTQV